MPFIVDGFAYCFRARYGSDSLNVYQKILLARDFAVRIGIFGMEALFLIDNRYRFGVTLFGHSQDIIGARAMYVPRNVAGVGFGLWVSQVLTCSLTPFPTLHCLLIRSDSPRAAQRRWTSPSWSTCCSRWVT